ncbi:MAG: hypothetical protein M3020_27300 [Myxococcota bacterium]|jgi:hypothetical protein|nr:hypothetical protein [Myxococcota bacterium]
MKIGVEAALTVLAGLSIAACDKKPAEARAEPVNTAVGATEVASAAPSASPSASAGKDGSCAPGGCAPGKCGGAKK